jgi:hypothetical protein
MTKFMDEDHGIKGQCERDEELWRRYAAGKHFHLREHSVFVQNNEHNAEDNAQPYRKPRRALGLGRGCSRSRIGVVLTCALASHERAKPGKFRTKTGVRT